MNPTATLLDLSYTPMPVMIDYTRPDDTYTKSYTLETLEGMVKFHGQIRVSSPKQERYFAEVNGQKKFLVYHKQEQRIELQDLKWFY